MGALRKLRSLYGNFRARFDPIINLGDDLVALFDAALDFNQGTELLTCAHRHFNGAIVSDLVDDRASGASGHCRFRDGEQQLVIRAVRFVTDSEEADFCAHLRQNPLVIFFKLDLHQDSCLGFDPRWEQSS